MTFITRHRHTEGQIELYRDAIWWAENRTVDQAPHWLEGFEHAIETLADPQRRPGSSSR